MRTSVALALITALLCVLEAFAAEEPQPLTIDFEEQAVVVSGVAPGATIYVYSLAREPKGYYTDIVPREIKLADDDRDGRVTWNLESPLPWRSIWFAADLGSGRYVAAAPPQYEQATRVELTSDHVKKDAAGEAVQLGFPGSIVEFVVVRPKSAAVWRATIASGGPLDEEPGPDKVRLSTLKLEPRVGTTDSPPSSLKNGDVLFMVTSFRSQYLAVRIGD